MVIAYHPQRAKGPNNTNTNYPPQRFDESGGTPIVGDMAYEDNTTMLYEDGTIMEYE